MAKSVYPLGGTLYTHRDVQAHESLYTHGVFPDSFEITVDGDTITLTPGYAWLTPERFSGFSFVEKDPYTIQLPAANSILDRIDTLVLRWSATANDVSFAVKSGAESSAPVAPELTRTAAEWELALYELYREHGKALTLDYVTDLRLDEELCGIMSTRVTQIPTDALLSQARARVDSTMSAADRQIADKAAAYRIKLDALAAELENLKRQSGVMLVPDYDPEGHDPGQLAFKNESMQLAEFNPDGHAAGQVAFKGEERKYRPGDIALWAPTPGGKDLSTAQKWADEYGGSWAKIMEGRALMGADAAHPAGTTTEAGLPNITGEIWNFATQSASQNVSNSGAFGLRYSNELHGYAANAKNDGIDGFNLDASRSSGIYGRSNTVQPSAYWVCVYLCLEGN